MGVSGYWAMMVWNSFHDALPSSALRVSLPILAIMEGPPMSGTCWAASFLALMFSDDVSSFTMLTFSGAAAFSSQVGPV